MFHPLFLSPQIPEEMPEENQMDIDNLLDSIEGSQPENQSENQTESNYEKLVSPVSGVEIDEDDIDSIIAAFEEITSAIETLKLFQTSLSELLISKNKSSNKTSRIQGFEYQCVIEKGTLSPNTTIVNAVRNQFPAKTKDLIVPSGYRVAAREYKKLQGTTFTDPDMLKIMEMLNSAYESGHTSPTKVKDITRIESAE